jgi:uncharacterized protein YjiS (DUF1127 family)
MYDGINFKAPHLKPVAADNADSVIAAPHVSREDIDALVRRAQVERAAAVAEAVAGVIAKAVLWFRERREKVASLRELQALDNRTLADIGVTRADLSALVYGARIAGPVLRGKMLVRFVEEKLLRPFRAWRLTARTRNELSALDDASLRDIGIERGQIDGIAATVAKARLDGRTVPVAAALVMGGFEFKKPANVNLPAGRAALDAAD